MLIRFTQDQVTVFLWSLMIGTLIVILMGIIKGDN
jgi:hypothetical protein